MKRIFYLVAMILSCFIHGQENGSYTSKIAEDFEQLLGHLSQYYIYGKERQVDFDCLAEQYREKLKTLKSKEQTVLFFEYFLDEFYDTHLILNTNTSSSFRLWSPIYITLKNDQPIVTNVWQSQIKKGLDHDIVGAKVLAFNTIDLYQLIEDFPTSCNDKTNIKIKEWIANKIVSGRYNEPRKLDLILKNGKQIVLDLDQIPYQKTSDLLSVDKMDNIAIVKINNSLGKDEVVTAFDRALDTLMNTKGLILDLRNTVDGGDAYEARGIMGRFVDRPKPYQKHVVVETSENGPAIERSWAEYVSPRLTTYAKPVVILVGRWTGSMGEGLAIGFEGMERGQVVGTKMERLAGEVFFFPFKNQSYGYRIPAVKLFHINGIPREAYMPTHYVQETSNKKDEILNEGLRLMRELTK